MKTVLSALVCLAVALLLGANLLAEEKVGPVAPGQTILQVRIGDDEAWAPVVVYEPVRTLEGLRDDQMVVVAPVRLARGDTIRWPLPDSPDPDDLRVTGSYFDRRPYVETDDHGDTVYVEHHRTVGDWVRAVVGAGLVLVDLVEPEWTPGRTQVWGQWSPARGALVPGTLILVCAKPA